MNDMGNVSSTAVTHATVSSVDSLAVQKDVGKELVLGKSKILSKSHCIGIVPEKNTLNKIKLPAGSLNSDFLGGRRGVVKKENEVVLDVNHLSTNGKFDRKLVDDNIENCQYKDDNSECVAAFGESKSLESGETGDKEDKCQDEDNLCLQNIEDDSVGHKESRRDLSEEKKLVIKQLVNQCHESVANLDKDHRVILTMVKTRSSSHRKFHDRGLKLIAELESIVKKFKEVRKEKDYAITDLKNILRRLTENLQVMEKKLKTLESRRENCTEYELQNKELKTNGSKEQQNENPNPLSTFQSNTNSKILTIEQNSSSLSQKDEIVSTEPDSGTKDFSPNNLEDSTLCSTNNNHVGLYSSFHQNDCPPRSSWNGNPKIDRQDGDGPQEIILNLQREHNSLDDRKCSNCDQSVQASHNNSESLTQRNDLSFGYWMDKANEFLRMNTEEREIHSVRGICSVLCLDTSESMSGEAFQTMVDLAIRFISGIQASPLPQSVGLVCFGEDTKVLSRCCTDFLNLKQMIKKLKPRGTSPLSAGLLLSCAVTKLIGGIPCVRGDAFYPRIIVLTDGVATPQHVTGNKDFTPEMSDILNISAEIAAVLSATIGPPVRVYSVLLGKADETMLGPAVRITGGKSIRPADFDKLIHQQEGELLAAHLRSYFPNFRNVEPDMVRAVLEASEHSIGQLDLEDLVEYIRNPPPQMGTDRHDNETNNSHRKLTTSMPPIGTRVRRGPDWRYNEQDTHGPGTVVDIDRDGFIFVMWDNRNRYPYPYGFHGDFAVTVVDEPRILPDDQLIDVGCLVKRGDDWRDNGHDGGPGSIGVVLRTHFDATVDVIWPTGQRRRYKYGKQGYFEVELCDPFDENVRNRMLSMNVQECSADSYSTSEFLGIESGGLRIEDVVISYDRTKNAMKDMNRGNATLEEMNKRNVVRSKWTSQARVESMSEGGEKSAEQTGGLNGKRETNTTVNS
ncbi:uncharacterized protein LOC128176543 [Crassostrea angulata]|uniref:uncharacterized protein LOC128176543 n=1 Tax=Magallana angulata TaxID=2784310 RepID=UPI0022B1CA5B|nr:uncharacterized protein LOC128176543 [Crassostrea angulata]